MQHCCNVASCAKADGCLQCSFFPDGKLYLSSKWTLAATHKQHGWSKLNRTIDTSPIQSKDWYFSWKLRAAKKTATTDFKQGRKLVLRSLQSATIMIEFNYRQQAPQKLQEQQQQQQRRQKTTNNRQHWQQSLRSWMRVNFLNRITMVPEERWMRQHWCGGRSGPKIREAGSW